MERIRCCCKHCGFNLGELLNTWTQIGKSYYSPVLDPHVPLKVLVHGEVRTGDKQTLVGECDLQDIACASCYAIVGLQCIRTPLNHVLAEDQVLLRFTSVTFSTGEDGVSADLNIRRSLQLREPGKSARTSLSSPPLSCHTTSTQVPPSGCADHPGDDLDHPEILQIQADLDVHREDISRLDSAGYQVVAAFNSAVSRIEGEVQNLAEALQSVRRDLDGNHDDLISLKTDVRDVRRTAEDSSSFSRLESHIASVAEAVSAGKRDANAVSSRFRKDLADLKSELLQAKQDIADLKSVISNGFSSTQEVAREVRALRGDISVFKKEREQDRVKQSGTANMAFPSRELDILTSNIAKIGNRASQVETLQMEFEILKGRIERMEVPGTNIAFHEAPQLDARADEEHIHARAFIAEERDSCPSSIESSPLSPKQKRSAHSLQDTECTSVHRAGTVSKSATNSTLPMIVVEPGNKKARLTRSTVVDRRSQRRVSKKSLADRNVGV